jgi:hypothetical protein
MAISDDRFIKLRGTLGKELVFREWDGKIIVSKAVKSRKGNFSPAQALTRERFQLASRYAKGIIQGQDQGIRDAYTAALKPRQTLYCRATEDFLSVPVVKKIDTGGYNSASGSRIIVHAVDDFRVVAVQVEIYSTGGTLLEKGNAVQEPNGIYWSYTATQENSPLTGSQIKAIAYDVPGNQGTRELRL